MSEVKTLATLVLGGAFDATELGDNEIYPDMGLIDALQQKLVTGFDDVSIELVSRSDLDSVQSELAALREELAKLRDSSAICGRHLDRMIEHSDSLEERLTAAEQRNSTLETELRNIRQSCVLSKLRGSRIDALLTKPTESGASE